MKKNRNQKQIDLLSSIEDEIQRYQKKVHTFKQELKESPDYTIYSSHKRAAVKRAAMDLRKELGRISKELTPYL